MTPPLISVVIPCYEQKQYLPDALGSIEHQMYPHIEVIVVDDGSAVPVTIPDDACTRFPVFLIRHERNCGLPAARNTGFREAKGTYVFPLDSDDLLDPTILEKLWLLLEQNRKHGFAYTDVHLFGEEEGMWKTQPYNLGRLLFQNHIPAGSLIRRRAWEDVHGYDETMRGGFEDWDFWLRLAEHGWYGIHLAEPLYHYRKYRGSMLKESAQNFDRLFRTIRRNHARLYSWPRRVAIAWQWKEWKLQPRTSLLDFAGQCIGTYLPSIFSLPLLRFGRFLVDHGILKSPACAASSPLLLPHVDRESQRTEESPTILLLIPWLCIGGVETFHRILIEGLTARGWRCIVVTTLRDSHPLSTGIRTMTPYLYHLGNLCPTKERTEKCLLWLLDNHRPDLLHLSHSELGYGTLPKIKRNFPHLPIAEVLHCDDPFARDYLDIRTATLPYLTHTITTNQALRRSLLHQHIGRPECISSIPHGTDAQQTSLNALSSLRQACQIPPEATVISFIGRLTAQKRPWIFLKVAARLQRHAPGRFVFLLAGDGMLKHQCRRLHRRLRLKQTMRFLGERSDIMTILGLSNWLLLPSSFEGLPFVILEAGVAGVPVIAPDVEGIPEVVGSDGGFLFDPKKPEEETIEEIVGLLLHTSEEERRRMSAALKRRVENGFRSDRMTDDFDRLYRSLLVSPRVFMYADIRKEAATVGP